jgi:flagellar FliL protein
MSNTPTAPAPAAAPAAADAPKKSRKGLFIIAGVALVAVLGGGGAAYWMFFANAPAAEAAEPAEEAGPGAAVALDPFVVNLADAGGTRYLRVSLSLVVADEAHAAEVAESEVTRARIRSAVLELLSLQTADRLITPDGKAEVKKAIAEAASHAVADLHVSDVLFSEFVVQF